MNVTVDEDRCCGHGVCLALCPEVFTLSDDGYAVAVEGEIPKEFESAVAEAVDACPEHAISAE